MKRLLWLDIAKGLAILWIVYFHFIRTYLDQRPVPPDNWNGFFESAVTVSRMVWLKISGLGLHAVGVFIILNGWALMQSTARRAAAGPMAWGQWYRARLFRLYPMYWVAHLVYLISPFVARWEQVDRRIVLSLLGLRFINIEVNFYYLNASWWFFSMIIQFYFIFPLLFRMAQRLGPWTFLLVACAIGFFARYLMLIVYPQNGAWILGGFAISRLPEFALGMALGMWHARSTARSEWFFLRGTGISHRVVALSSGAPALPQWLHLRVCRFRHWRMLLVVNSRRRWISCAALWARTSIRPHWHLLLWHFPYSSALCHLAGPAHPGATDVAVPIHRCRDSRCR